ncbi:MAG: outer membrane lipoprotein-sorting protein, partial [Nevskiaceae bacterium]
LYGTRETDRARVMMRIETPQDLAGAAYLVRETEKGDETYLYLPAVQKVRRISGGQMDGQLWGTDLSYNDIKQLQNAFSGAEAALENTVEPYEGRAVQAVSFTPRTEDGSRYRSVRTLVDRKTCVALRVEFFEPAGMRKVLTVAPADLRQSGPHWYAGRAQMSDLRNATHTRVVVTGVTSGDKLAGRYFSPQSFYLGN